MTSSTLSLTGRNHPSEQHAATRNPWLQTFALFDRILILQRGRVVYFGPNGSSALEYFQGSPHFQVGYHCRRVLQAAVSWKGQVSFAHMGRLWTCSHC